METGQGDFEPLDLYILSLVGITRSGTGVAMKDEETGASGLLYSIIALPYSPDQPAYDKRYVHSPILPIKLLESLGGRDFLVVTLFSKKTWACGKPHTLALTLVMLCRDVIAKQYNPGFMANLTHD